MSTELHRTVERSAADLIERATFLEEGRHGSISTVMVSGECVAIKQGRDDGVGGVARNEATYLKAANEAGVGPKLLHYDSERKAVFRRFMVGWRFDDWARFIDRHGGDPLPVLRSVFQQCFRLDQRGVHRPELSRPHKDLIVTADGPVIIDFERCRFRPLPRNVPQFVECVLRKRYASLFGIGRRERKKRRLRGLLRRYADSPDASVKDELVNAVLGWVSG